MQTILPPSGNTIKILGKPKLAEHGLRWMTYVLAQPVEGGVLVFHTLTRALLLLTPEEYAAPDNLPELRSSWFRVPQEMLDSDEVYQMTKRGLDAVQISTAKRIHLNLVLVKLLELHHLGYDLRHYHAQHHAFIKQFNLPAHFQFDVAAG